jgi:hypothetical protein
MSIYQIHRILSFFFVAAVLLALAVVALCVGCALPKADPPRPIPTAKAVLPYGLDQARDVVLEAIGDEGLDKGNAQIIGQTCGHSAITGDGMVMLPDAYHFSYVDIGSTGELTSNLAINLMTRPDGHTDLKVYCDPSGAALEAIAPHVRIEP